MVCGYYSDTDLMLRIRALTVAVLSRDKIRKPRTHKLAIELLGRRAPPLRLQWGIVTVQNRHSNVHSGICIIMIIIIVTIIIII